MDRASFENAFKYEEDYWWFVGRRRIVFSLIDKLYKQKGRLLALDAGCGTGMMLKGLERGFLAVGMDLSKTALEYARRRGCGNLTCGNLCALPFGDETFDVITILGVLYNRAVKDEEKAMRESFRVLKKGGIMVIDEAAHNFLQSRHNISVDGVRRFTRRGLICTAKRCGFEVPKSSYWNALMMPAFFAAVRLERFLDADKKLLKVERMPRALNNLLTSYLRMEAVLLRYATIPFGPSVILVGRKP